MEKRCRKVLKLRRSTIVALTIMLGICCVFFYQFVMIPRIGFYDSSTKRVNYKAPYVDGRYWATYRGRDITSKVEVRGDVDTSKLGKHVIKYRVKYAGVTKTKKRTVIVEDKVAPVIRFLKHNHLYLCPNQGYKKDDYKAIDNYDGDLTDKVEVQQRGSFMRYTVVDQFGNKSVIHRRIVVKDRDAPSITLKGDALVTLVVGDAYTDPMYEAKDTCDGDLTSKVKVKSNLDTSKPGEYILTYQVSDHAGNEGKAERKVLVVEPEQKGTIYLTFDDGPRSGTTDIILDILKEENIKATFFVTNGGPDDLILRAYQEGHTIALHTATHNYSELYSSGDAYFSDLYSVFDRVKRITGEESKIIRFPGGSSNTISRKYSLGIMSYLTSEVIRRGFRYYDWNINSMDAEGKKYTPSEIAQHVISKLSHERVNMVLMHDVKPITRDAIREIIHYAKANGFPFSRITTATDMVVQRVNN